MESKRVSSAEVELADGPAVGLQVMVLGDNIQQEAAES